MPVRLDALEDVSAPVRLDSVLTESAQPAMLTPRQAVRLRLDEVAGEGARPRPEGKTFGEAFSKASGLESVIKGYQAYRANPLVQRYNEFAGKLPAAIRTHFLPETPMIDPATGQINRINVPLETLKGTTRELAALATTFDTDVLATLMVGGPAFRALGKIPLGATGRTLAEVFNTPVGKGFFKRAFLPPQVQAKVATGFRPESVLVPQAPVTPTEAAEAAKEGAAFLLSERPLTSAEILELYKVRYNLELPSPRNLPLPTMKALPSPSDVPPPKVIPLGTTFVPPKGLPAPVLPEQEPQSALGRVLKQQMAEVEQVPLHPAKAGRAALKRIFGGEAGFVALPEDEEALSAMLNATKLVGAQATANLPKFAENINLSKINDASVRAAMHDIIEQRPIAATTPHITNQTLLKQAESLKDTPTIRTIVAMPEGRLEAEALRNRQEQLSIVKSILDKQFGEEFKTEMDAAILAYRKPGSIFARALQAQAIPAEARAQVLERLNTRIAQVLRDPVLRGDRQLHQLLFGFRKELAAKELLIPTLLDKAYFAWMNSILSSPITHAVNSLSNLASAWAKIPEKFFAALVDVPVSAVTKQRTHFFGEIPAMIRGAFTRTAIPLAPGTKLDLQRYSNPFGTGRGAQAIGLPTSALQVEDEMAKGLVGKMELFGQTYRLSAQAGLKGTAADIAQRAILASPSEALMNRVGKEQLYRTFQDAPSMVGKALLALRAHVPGARWVLPFIRTPDRILQAGFVERTPLQLVNIARKAYRWKTIGAEYTQEEFTKDAGLLAMSAAIAGWAGWQYLKGNLTGNAPQSPAERAAFFASGKKANAFRLGGLWIPFERLEPLGTSLTSVINTMQLYATSNKEAPTDKILDALGGLAKTLTNKTYLSGLTNFVNVMTDPERYGGTLASRTMAGAVPGAVNLAAQLQHPYYLKPEGVRESVMARIPMLAEQVPKRLGRFGEAQRRDPLNIGVEHISRVDRELNQLGHTIGFPDTSIGTRKLTNKEYNELLELAGPISYQTLDRMFQHPAYRVLPEEEKRKEIDAVVREDREVARERVRLRLILRELQSAKSQPAQRRILGKLKDQKVLTSELYFELKDRGLIR